MRDAVQSFWILKSLTMPELTYNMLVAFQQGLKGEIGNVAVQSMAFALPLDSDNQVVSIHQVGASVPATRPCY